MTHDSPTLDDDHTRPSKVAKTDDQPTAVPQSSSAKAEASATATATASCDEPSNDATASTSIVTDTNGASENHVNATAKASSSANASSTHNDDAKPTAMDSSNHIDVGEISKAVASSVSPLNSKPTSHPLANGSVPIVATAAAAAAAAAAAVVSGSSLNHPNAQSGCANEPNPCPQVDEDVSVTQVVKSSDDDDANKCVEMEDIESSTDELDLRSITLQAYVARRGFPPVVDEKTLTDDQATAVTAEKLDVFRAAVSARKAVCILLAAGQGSRFNAKVPKVVHPFLGKALAQHALDAAEAASLPVIVIVGHARQTVIKTLNISPEAHVAFVPQDERLGTGHAVYLAKSALPNDFDGTIIVSYADNPGVDCDFLHQLLKGHEGFAKAHGDRYAAMVVTGSRKHAGDGASNYGRIVRTGGPEAKAEGSVVDIVEKKTITKMIEDKLDVTYCDDVKWSGEQLDAIDEFNSGIVVANSVAYLDVLGDVMANMTKKDPAKYEYYATDFVKGLVAKNYIVQGFRPDVKMMWKLEGANTVEELKELEEKVRANLEH